MIKSSLGNGMIIGALLLAAPWLHAQTNPDWTTPIAPFHIAGNLYYVGGKDLASYLIVTPKGDILINPSLESSVPMISASVKQLGFKFKDIKILLISHFDPSGYQAAVAEREQAFATELKRQETDPSPAQ